MSKTTDEGVTPKGMTRRQCDDALRPHLSALVDGELHPLEAIALHQHMRQSPPLEAEHRQLERLKMAVHLAGTLVSRNAADFVLLGANFAVIEYPVGPGSAGRSSGRVRVICMGAEGPGINPSPAGGQTTRPSFPVWRRPRERCSHGAPSRHGAY